MKRKPLPGGAAPDAMVVIGGETLPSPYHVQSGSLFFVGGTANAAIVTPWLATEGLFPILDTRGRALAGIWIGDFERANLGAHQEFQISLFARSPGPGMPVPDHPFALFRELLAPSGTLMVCHGLWNNTERVVRYNRDHLSLDARLAAGVIDQTKDRCQFSFTQDDGAKIAEGILDTPRQSAAEAWTLARQVGFGALIKASLAPCIEMSVVTTRRPDAPDTRVSHTVARCTGHVTRRFTTSDRLVLHHERYRDLGFEPRSVQHQQGFELVFPPPDPLPA